MLRGKAFECLSLLGMAVGKTLFLPDAVDAMNVRSSKPFVDSVIVTLLNSCKTLSNMPVNTLEPLE